MGATDKTLGGYWRTFLGLKGTTDIDDTATHTGPYWRVVCQGNTVFSSTTTVNGTAENFGGSTFPALFEFRANFDKIALASGHVVATKY